MVSRCDYRYLAVKRPAQLLQRVLEEWIECTQEYANDAADLSYSHTEMANVSVLAAASWRARRVAISEYSSSKMIKGRKKTGRTDLFISDGRTCNIAIETKRRPWRKQTSDRERLASSLQKACKEVAGNREYMPSKRYYFGALFVPVFLRKRDPPIETMEERRRLFENFKEEMTSVKADAVAICFPKFGPRLTKQYDRWTWQWPGAGILVRKALWTQSA